jgi:hypothetical protein
MHFSLSRTTPAVPDIQQHYLQWKTEHIALIQPMISTQPLMTLKKKLKTYITRDVMSADQLQLISTLSEREMGLAE